MIKLYLFNEELIKDEEKYYTSLGKENINFRPVWGCKFNSIVNNHYLYVGGYAVLRDCIWDSFQTYRAVEWCKNFYKNDKFITKAADIFLKHYKDQYEKYSIFE
jgi:hypothetical protein